VLRYVPCPLWQCAQESVGYAQLSDFSTAPTALPPLCVGESTNFVPACPHKPFALKERCVLVVRTLAPFEAYKSCDPPYILTLQAHTLSTR